LFSVALGIGGAVLWLAIRWNRQQKSLGTHSLWANRASRSPQRPILWLAIRSQDPTNVLKALSLSDAAPCSWGDGVAHENRLFIAPQVRGWVLVTGKALPDPADDVDTSFRFLRELSRKLGEVQFFCADRLLHHHAWVRLEAGRVIRAYAWADVTLWNQGVKTAEENALDLKSLGYGEEASIHWGMPDFLAANVEKIPQLAARWSLDPAEIAKRLPAHALWITGRLSARY